MRTGFCRSLRRVGLGVVVVLALPFVAMLLTDDVRWSLADFVLCGVLLAVLGAAVELARKSAGNLPTAIAIGGLGIVCGVLGERDDAPGLVLLGLLLLGSGGALAARLIHRAS